MVFTCCASVESKVLVFGLKGCGVNFRRPVLLPAFFLFSTGAILDLDESESAVDDVVDDFFNSVEF